MTDVNESIDMWIAWQKKSHETAARKVREHDVCKNCKHWERDSIPFEGDENHRTCRLLILGDIVTTECNYESLFITPHDFGCNQFEITNAGERNDGPKRV